MQAPYSSQATEEYLHERTQVNTSLEDHISESNIKRAIEFASHVEGGGSAVERTIGRLRERWVLEGEAVVAYFLGGRVGI